MTQEEIKVRASVLMAVIKDVRSLYDTTVSRLIATQGLCTHEGTTKRNGHQIGICFNCGKVFSVKK